MTIKHLKEKYNLKDKDIAKFFDLKPEVFANSTAKKRYEKALCRFYEFIEKRNSESKCELKYKQNEKTM